MRTELRKWEAGSRHLSYPHCIGGDAMLPLGDTSSLKNFRVKLRGCKKNGCFERYSLCVIVYYLHTFILYWLWFIDSLNGFALLVFPTRSFISGQEHTFRVLSQRTYYAAFNVQKKNLQIVHQTTSTFFSMCLSIPNCLVMFCNNPWRFGKEPSWKLYDLYQVFSSLKMVPCSSVPSACEKRGAKLSACQTTKRRRRNRNSVSDILSWVVPTARHVNGMEDGNFWDFARRYHRGICKFWVIASSSG